MEKIAKGIADALPAIEQRMKQSARDTARFEASKAQPAAGIPQTVRDALAGVRLESGEDMDVYLARATEKEELNQYRAQAQQVETDQRKAQESTQLYYDHLAASGIDKGDPRLDWTTIEGWHKSIANIKSGAAKVEEKPKPKADEGDNFVDTASSAGTTSSAIPKTRAALTKFYQEASSEEVAKLKPEIEKALFEGRIKD